MSYENTCAITFFSFHFKRFYCKLFYFFSLEPKHENGFEINLVNFISLFLIFWKMTNVFGLSIWLFISRLSAGSKSSLYLLHKLTIEGPITIFTRCNLLKIAFKPNVFILGKSKESQTALLLIICYLNNISTIKTDSAREFMKSLYYGWPIFSWNIMSPLLFKWWFRMFSKIPFT